MRERGEGEDTFVEAEPSCVSVAGWLAGLLLVCVCVLLCKCASEHLQVHVRCLPSLHSTGGYIFVFNRQ